MASAPPYPGGQQYPNNPQYNPYGQQPPQYPGNPPQNYGYPPQPGYGQGYGQPYPNQPYPQQTYTQQPGYNPYPQQHVVMVDRERRNSGGSGKCCLVACIACMLGCCVADCCD